MWLAFLADSHVAGWLGASRPKATKEFARQVSFYGDFPPLVVGALLVAGVGVLVKRRCTRIVCIMIVAASLEGGKPVLASFLEEVPIGARLK